MIGRRRRSRNICRAICLLRLSSPYSNKTLAICSFVGGVDKLVSRHPHRRIEPQVERTVALEAESVTGIVELHAGNAEVEENAVRLARRPAVHAIRSMSAKLPATQFTRSPNSARFALATGIALGSRSMAINLPSGEERESISRL